MDLIHHPVILHRVTLHFRYHTYWCDYVAPHGLLMFSHQRQYSLVYPVSPWTSAAPARSSSSSARRSRSLDDGYYFTLAPREFVILSEMGGRCLRLEVIPLILVSHSEALEQGASRHDPSLYGSVSPLKNNTADFFLSVLNHGDLFCL